MTTKVYICGTLSDKKLGIDLGKHIDGQVYIHTYIETFQSEPSFLTSSMFCVGLLRHKLWIS